MAITAAIIALVTSLSARRAWIEISVTVQYSASRSVALRKESVDRNTESPLKDNATDVALRKESVDRNPSNSS